MRKQNIYCFILVVLCLTRISLGKSIEKEEEKTNAIIKEVEAEVSTSVSAEPEPEAEVETTEVISTEAETTETINEITESGTTEEPTTREPEECNADLYCKYTCACTLTFQHLGCCEEKICSVKTEDLP